ncbi:uncharacterized membrane protein YoaK (UPF0700 family) [Variovorax boronicumulans]|uniref:YoaK family protein n=1 Tax=Variovorax boronicumulans TaxID=436515 RepID=UPI0024738576|nr:YoaK family protein [Variovorax boronicumulans]MDH6170646.1 uncharacterized membrane protein YoaK (UPF0700 family) [Variovorax boronicumulans]
MTNATPATSARAPAAENPPDSAWRGMLLAFTGGFVDTLGFVALFGLFTAHVTGNFVLIGAAMAGSAHSGVVGKLLALPMFVLGVAATRIFQLRRERRGLDTAVPLMATQLLFLLAFMVAGVWAGPFVSGNGVSAIAVGLVGVLTMSIQNTAARSVFARLTPSTVMTGNVTQLVMDLVDMAVRAPATDAAAGRVRKAWPPIAAFAVGSLAGGLGYAHAGFWALLAPCAALAALLGLLRKQ